MYPHCCGGSKTSFPSLQWPGYKAKSIRHYVSIFTIGLLDAPTDVNVDQVSVESVNVSWTPPFTLSEVPILMYTVYITSQGYTETINTTETRITLERPCASTTYEISAWNEVGEGDIATCGETSMDTKC